MPQRTYATRLAADPARDPLLAAYADLYGRVERTLFARLCAGDAFAAPRRASLARFGLTARQFNALAADLRGKVSSIRKRRPRLIATLERRLARAKQVLTTIPRGTTQHHQKRRRLAILEQRLAALRADETTGRTRLCFGSRKLFRRQFALAANGYASHDEWRCQWRAARASQFFVLGSKDETAGCQGCVATVEPDRSLTLRLRLPNALAANGKYVVLSGPRFAYGHGAVVAALDRNLSPDKRDWEAVSWRFVRDGKGWRVLVTVSMQAGAPVSVDGIGVVAVDLNSDHLAVTDVDRFGNPIASFRVARRTQGKSQHQAAAALGEAVSQVVTYTCLRQKSIVAERLDFEVKRAELERTGVRYARMLSGFAYTAFHQILAARTHDAGITLHRVHPAFTSVIGTHEFAHRYGLSRHQAAALCIGRRGMGLAERPSRRMGAHVAFPPPVRNLGKHV